MKVAFCEQPHAAQEKLPNGDIVIAIGDLNDKVRFGNAVLRHMMAKA